MDGILVVFVDIVTMLNRTNITIALLWIAIIVSNLMLLSYRWMFNKMYAAMRIQQVKIDNYQNLIDNPTILLTPQQQCILYYEAHCDASGELPSRSKPIPQPTPEILPHVQAENI